MSKEVTSQNIIAAFPYALSQSDNLAALAKVVADELEVLYDNNDLLTIYANIDKLPEDLLDILAKDFKVDWYLYNGTLASKRAQIKSCFYVHRHYGTKGEIIEALSDLCPGTDIEEWFEYGGDPYYFRIVLDVTEQRLPIDQNDIIRIARILKPTRSVLESDGISYRSRNGFLIGVVSGYVFFSTRLCGTYPKAAVTGQTENGNIAITSSAESAEYSSRVCGWPLGSL